MPDWRESTLGEVANIAIGRTPPTKDPRYWTDDLARPFCTIADMKGRAIDPCRQGITELAESEGKAKRVPRGALLMSFKLSIGRVGFAARDIFPNEAIAWLNPKSPDLSDRFLALALEGQDLTRGSGRAVKGSTLNGHSLRAIRVAFPPLNEQRRIITVIATVDSQIEALEREASRASDVRAALIKTVLANAAESCVIDHYAEVSQGRSLPKAVQGQNTGAVSWFKIADMAAPRNVFGYVEAATRLSQSEIVRLGGRVVSRGSVVFPRVGAAVLTEKKRILDVEGAVDENHLVLTPRSGVDPEFVLGLMEQFRLGSLTQTGAVPSLNMGLIRAATVPLVQLDDQRKLGTALGAIREAAKSFAVEIAVLRAVRADLLSALLSQEITVNDAVDEFIKQAV